MMYLHMRMLALAQLCRLAEQILIELSFLFWVVFGLVVVAISVIEGWVNVGFGGLDAAMASARHALGEI